MIKREQDIIVPRGIRYLSEWNWFSLARFPKKFILDKQLPGCGFTNYSLSGPENVVLCSPRKVLLENKAYSDKFKDEVYLVINEASIEASTDKDLIPPPCIRDITIPIEYLVKVDKIVEEVVGENIDSTRGRIQCELEHREKGVFHRLYKEIKEYIEIRRQQGKPLKILVTYDSYRIVQAILKLLKVRDYYTVVDEYQVLLQDAVFKADVEVNFFGRLSEADRVCFVSATPMLEEYMNLLEEFNGLPYFTLDWATDDPERIVKPDLKVLTMKSVGTAALPIIRDYLIGNYKRAYRKNKGTGEVEIIDSKECIIFLNSIRQMLNIISKAKLEPSQVNILCADTPNNRARIRRKLGSRWKIGKVPKENEPNKMFTFCTRTVYLGADFYSDNARTFIFSDSNIESLAVDIGEDLPQILGRQRSDANPWKNCATFFYRSTVERRNMTQESLSERIKEKKRRTSLLLSAYDRLVEQDEKFIIKDNYRKVAESYNYRDDYVSLKDGVPVLNMFVLLNEIRSFRIQQIDYKDRVSIFSAIVNKLDPKMSKDDEFDPKDVLEFVKEYSSYSTYYDKMKALCNNNLSPIALQVALNQLPGTDSLKMHFQTLGAERCKALGYSITSITRELSKVTYENDGLREAIYKEFEVGKEYLPDYLKRRITDLYREFGNVRTPLIKDLTDYFDLKVCYKRGKDEVTGKRTRYITYKILNKKK